MAKVGKMRFCAAAAATFAATAAFGGFWDVVNKVQRTAEVVSAVGEIVNGQQQPAPAVAAPAVPAAAAVPSVDQALVAQFASMRTTATDTAVPEVKYGTLYVEKPATPEQVAAAKNAWIATKRSLDNANIRFKGKIDDATLAAVLAVFNRAGNVDIRADEGCITSLAPLSLLREVRVIYIEHVDLGGCAAFAAMPKLQRLSLHYCTVSSFAPLAASANLASLDLYGSKVSGSFAPLAACPKLSKIEFYAVKGPKETYDSLGALTQVKDFHGGLTKMTSLAWLATVPQTEALQIFAEKIDSLAPVSSLANLTYFRGWNMDGGSMATALGDLSFLANCRKLKKLELPGSAYSNTAIIGTFTELEELDLSNAKQPVDVSFVASLPRLKKLAVRGTEVVNGASVPASVKISKDKKTKGL